MRFTRAGILVLVMLAAGAAVGFAQTTDSDGHDISVAIAEVQLIQLENTTAVALATVAPTNAGDQVTVTGPFTKDLYYTLLSDTAVSTVSAQLNANFSGGTEWHVELTASTSGGSQGAGSTITLTNASTDLITGISSVATTQTNGTCPSLSYALVLDTPASLTTMAAETRTLTLTLSNL